MTTRQNRLGLFAEAARAATVGALLLCAGLACGVRPPGSESPPNPDLQGGPMAEGDARRIAERAAEGLRSPSPELKAAFIGKVATMLAHRDPTFRASAAEDLGGLARKAASGPLQRALQDPDRGVRAAAARALGAAGEADAAPALIECLKDPAPAVREASAAALGTIGAREAGGGRQPATPGQPREHLSAGARDFAGPLAALLNDADPAVRREAVRSLGLLREPNALAPLARALAGDADVQVRAAAAAGLGLLGLPGGARHLAEALGDEAALVRHAAAGALGAIGDRLAVPSLIATLKDRHASVRAAAAHALGRLADPSSAAALSEAARTDPDESVRAAAREAVGKWGSTQTAPGR